MMPMSARSRRPVIVIRGEIDRAMKAHNCVACAKTIVSRDMSELQGLDRQLSSSA
jgi:hypothetical protein